jgi:putative ABC transport system ATP-binding protein
VSAVQAQPAVVCDRVVHIYRRHGIESVALSGVDLVIPQGQTVALLGPSGAGKSTLLALMAGLLQPTAGLCFVHGRNLGAADERQLMSMRAREVGIVLQTPGRNLLPYASASDNVAFAQRPTRRTPAAKRRRTLTLLDAVGLAQYARTRAGAMAGGEQQRLAVAVALANGPRILLADEPTSQLDRENASQVVALLAAANADLGTTVVLVTHDPSIAASMQRTVTIRDGRVGGEGRAGEEFIVVGREGSVVLPANALEVLPPGSLARVHVHPDRVELDGPGRSQEKAPP